MKLNKTINRVVAALMLFGASQVHAGKHELLEDGCLSDLSKEVLFRLQVGPGPTDHNSLSVLHVKEGGHTYKVNHPLAIVVEEKRSKFVVVEPFTTSLLLDKIELLHGDEALKLIPKDAPDGQYYVYKLIYEKGKSEGKPESIALLRKDYPFGDPLYDN